MNLADELQPQPDAVRMNAVSAAQHGNYNELENFMNKGLSANTTDDDGCSLLHWAAINNKIKAVQLLIERGADVNKLGGILCSSPLHWAARNGYVTVCAILVKAGANCHIRDTQGYTPVHLAVQGAHVPLTAYFLLKLDYAKDVTDNSGMTPTMWCAFRSYQLFPLRLILNTGPDLNLKEKLAGNTALHMAVNERNHIAVNELIAAGADLSIRNYQQETALDIARIKRNPHILEAVEKAARKQGLTRSKLCSNGIEPPLSTYLYFLLPAFALFLTGFLFTYASFPVALMLFASMLVYFVLFIRIDFHSRTQRLFPIGITITEACMIVYSWIFYLQIYAMWWIQLFFVFSTAMIFITLIRITRMDPGILRPTSDSKRIFVEEAESAVQRQEKYCFSCFVKKFDHTKHCAVCDHCVNNFDHHCPWLNRCVTRKNSREFILFVASVATSSAIYSLTAMSVACTESRIYGFDIFLINNPYLVSTTVLALLHVFALFSLFFVQLSQISQKVTTNDRLKMNRVHVHDGDHEHGAQKCQQDQPLSLAQRIRNISDFFASFEDEL